MIDQNQILKALIAKKNAILDENKKFKIKPTEYVEFLKELEGLSKEEFNKITKGKELARPVIFEEKIKRSINSFESLDDAIKWSTNILNGTTLVAIDGSQILPSKELSYPIALVQTGYFIISFDEEARIEYDTDPNILISSDSVTNGQTIREGDVSLIRQSKEIETAKKLLEKLEDYPNPIILLDGTLIYSYMATLLPKTRNQAIKELVSFLNLAERKRIPVVGYIDTSYAKDLSTTLHLIKDIKGEEELADPGYLDSELTELGDYTIPFICRRKPIPDYENYANKICFSYLRVNSKRVVRLEFPFWIWKKGKYEDVISKILAEGIISHGYPRVLTRAHEVAVLTGQDKEKFNQIVLKYFNDYLEIPVTEMIKANMKHRFD